MKANIFASKQLRNWVFKGCDASNVGLEDVSLLGRGPFGQHDLRSFFHRVKLDVFSPDAYTEVLVLGREGWRESEIQSLLRKRSRKTLRVYSQEMFLLYLLSERDPLEAPTIAIQLGQDHPGLDLLRSLGFKWPTTQVKGFGSPSSNSAAWGAEGFLRATGYRVGYNANNTPRERRRALVHAFRTRVPRRFGPDYSAFWGPPSSSLRLERMANSLARFYRLASGRQYGDFSAACKHWERDLAWLKQKYYAAAHQRFAWPSIHVG